MFAPMQLLSTTCSSTVAQLVGHLHLVAAIHRVRRLAASSIMYCLGV